MLEKKLGIIDLTNGTIEITETSDSLRRAYFGGRGLNMYYLNKMLDPSVDALSPDNILIFGTGFMTGTLALNSSRFNVSAKSP